MDEAQGAFPGTKARLHIGGTVRREGWQVLNIEAGPHVDHVGDCADLSRFADGSFAEVYAAHVLEHLGYRIDLPVTIAGIYRVLEPGGLLRMSVPDLARLSEVFARRDLAFEDRVLVMQMMFGGQLDAHDFHRVGLFWELARRFLARAGFVEVRRVEELGVFEDTSSLRLYGKLVSLNLEARKPR